MPIFGTLDEKSLETSATAVVSLATEDQETKLCETLVFTTETGAENAIQSVPKALHPAIPAYGKLEIRRHRDSPWGPFSLAELKITGRATTIYMGYCPGAFCDNDKVISYLCDRYGARVKKGGIFLDRRYYGIEASVRDGDKVVFDGAVDGLHFISGADVLYTPTLHLAKVDGKLLLVQEERECTIERAERGTPHVRRFDGAAFGEKRFTFAYDLPATFTKSTMSYRNVRFLMDPSVPARQGTTRLEKKAA